LAKERKILYKPSNYTMNFYSEATVDSEWHEGPHADGGCPG
jgi:hypothetical protein